MWLGTAAGIVQSWNGVWSNALIFTVPGGSGTAARLNPNILTMLVGDTHTIQALDSSGHPVTGLTWTSSDTNVVSLSTDDPPVLSALAVGHVTITAGGASADVTVSAGSTDNPGTLPLGTVLWSNPGDGSGVYKIVPAVPSPSGVADVFAFQYSDMVEAITSDGTTAWTADVSNADAVPDFLGELVMAVRGDIGSTSIVRLDGTTGQPAATYTAPGDSGLDGPVPHPDGTIFAVQYDRAAAPLPEGFPPWFAHRVSAMRSAATNNRSTEPCWYTLPLHQSDPDARGAFNATGWSSTMREQPSLNALGQCLGNRWRDFQGKPCHE